MDLGGPGARDFSVAKKRPRSDGALCSRGTFHFHSEPRDPDLSRKPPESQGKRLAFEKDDGGKEWGINP